MLHRNVIAGEWVAGDASANINPSNTNDVVGEYASASADDALRAIEAAKTAFPAWSRSPTLDRHAILRKASDEILDRKQELGELLAREEGKTLPEAIGEVTRAGQIFDFFAVCALPAKPCRRSGPASARGDPRACRRGRHRHAVELSNSNSGLEDGARPRLRQHGRPEAG